MGEVTIRKQSGDTIIEVAIALTILATVLTLSFVVANKVARVGLASRERTQAINYLQEQAEALRQYRGTSASWASFRAGIPAGRFHMVAGAGWSPAGGNLNDPNVPMIFRDTSLNRGIYITATQTDADTYDFSLTAKWENPGGGQDNQTVIYSRLVNIDGLAPI